MPRFVILTHDWPTLHWDFLVEAGGVLRAWRLLGEPGAGVDISAEPNFDHRLFYLDYEGPVSGDRGSVARWDAGGCEWRPEESARVELDIRGAKLSGRVVIWREAEAWLFRFTARAPEAAG